MFLFGISKCSESRKENNHQFEVMSSTKHHHQNQREHEQPCIENDFQQVKVSIGFVRSLQDSVLRLEQNQQHLIAQLDNANSLVTEYHDTAREYHQKYDRVIFEMEDMKRRHEHEIAVLFEKIQNANEDAESERKINQIHREQIELLERQIAQQASYAAISQATTATTATTANVHNHNHNHNGNDSSDNREILSPVSIASLSPRAPLQYGRQLPSLEPETPECDDEEEDDEEEDEEDGVNHSEYRNYYINSTHNPYDYQSPYSSSQNSQTTDCSGDPICHSDTDSDY